MGPQQAPIRLCLRQNYTILVEEVLAIFILLVPVYNTGLKTSAEGSENILIF